MFFIRTGDTGSGRALSTGALGHTKLLSSIISKVEDALVAIEAIVLLEPILILELKLEVKMDIFY